MKLWLWGFLRLRFGGGGFRFVYFAMPSGTWQQNGFGGVHNTAKEPPSFFKKKKIPKAQHLKLARSPLRGGRFKQAHGSDFWSFGFGVLRCLRVYYGSRAKA